MCVCACKRQRVRVSMHAQREEEESAGVNKPIGATRGEHQGPQ